MMVINIKNKFSIPISLNKLEKELITNLRIIEPTIAGKKIKRIVIRVEGNEWHIEIAFPTNIVLSKKIY